VSEKINLSRLREAINISADPSTVHVNGDIVLALIDTAEAAIPLVDHLDNVGGEGELLHRLRETLERYEP
jgi:hypothetical protein